MGFVNLLQHHDRVSHATKAVWTARRLGEEEAPEQRIIHIRCLQSDLPFRVHRIGIQMGVGFMKCGSEVFLKSDWIRSFRVLHLNEQQQWEELLVVNDVPRPSSDDHIQYFDLHDFTTRAIIIELRRSGIDQWWPSWNLAMDGFVLEGWEEEVQQKIFPTQYRTLTLEQCSIDRLPPGVQATLHDTEVRYHNDRMEVGFHLTRTGFSYFAVKPHRDVSTTQNLLQYPSLDNWSILHNSPNGNFWRRNTDLTQGLHLYPYGNHELVGHYQQDYEGTIHLEGNRITYRVNIPKLHQHIRLTWTVEKDRIVLDAERSSSHEVRLWSSGIWSMALNSRAAATTVIGELTKQGQASSLNFPLLFHAPNYGTLNMTTLSGDGLLRFDSIRPAYTNTYEIKCGEIPQPEGDYLLPAGKYSLQLSIAGAEQPSFQPVRGQPPAIVREAVHRSLITGLTFRPDLATLSNNGNSIHSPLCMEHWAFLTTLIHRVAPDWHAKSLLQLSIERWLLDGTGYAGGRSFFFDGWIEDEYVMTGASSILGLAQFILHLADEEWIQLHKERIYDKLEQLKARDVDQDGLIESTGRNERHGVSGKYSWSSNWYDILSYGWKDAFSNALLYRALRILEQIQPRFDMPERRIDFQGWAEQMKKSYFEQFYNSQTGWFAGWRCKENQLHDYAFLVVNGAASVAGLLDDQPDLHRAMIEKLVDEMHRCGFRAFSYGLPGNLWNIPGSDTSPMSHHRPFSCYQNGGATLSQARFFLQAMYNVGMEEEADRIIAACCQTIVDGRAFAGCASGIDWRMWDGTPGGYEGLLTDQLGIFVPILERYYV